MFRYLNDCERKIGAKQEFPDNPFHDIFAIYIVSVQLSFSTSKTEFLSVTNCVKNYKKTCHLGF